jgi:hypothetical protein
VTLFNPPIAADNCLHRKDGTRNGFGSGTGTAGLATRHGGILVSMTTVEPDNTLLPACGVDPITSGTQSPDQSVEKECANVTLSPSRCSAAYAVGKLSLTRVGTVVAERAADRMPLATAAGTGATVRAAPSAPGRTANKSYELCTTPSGAAPRLSR